MGREIVELGENKFKEVEWHWKWDKREGGTLWGFEFAGKL